MEFNVIVAVDSEYGISKGGIMPWKCPEDTQWFREQTEGGAIIMGRKTWESIGCRALPNRRNIVLTISNELPGKPTVCHSFNEALSICADEKKVFVIGGADVYAQALAHQLCRKVYITYLSSSFSCDTFFPKDLLKNRYAKYEKELYLSAEAYVSTYESFNDNEMHYLHIAKELLSQPQHKNRTEVDTKSIFAVHFRFDLRNGTLPLLTTKKINWKTVYSELLWFIRGQTNIKELHKNNVHIWDDNASKSFLESRGLDYEAGELGPIYGYQWRKWGGDQLGAVINNIKKDPFSRRHIVSAWNVNDLHKMALPPCHCFFQFVVEADELGNPVFLNCMLHQRSGDLFLGVPFNIASYAMLTHMVAHITGLRAKELVINIGDCHLYISHEEPLKKQLCNFPRYFPTLKFNGTFNSIDEFKEDSVDVVNYYPHKFIPAKMVL